MEDCYFFYNSDCSKGSSCQYRHEPAALHSEVVCSFWLQGHCSKVPCPFRHAELSGPIQSKTPCYWESRPGGCRKTHCPFQHKGILTPSSASQSSSIIHVPSSKIIVNKNKINEIGPLLAKTIESERIVIPSTPKGSVKDRLGYSTKKGCVKDRLGVKGEGDEEEFLRERAIQSLDLRKRISRASDDKALPLEDDESEEEGGSEYIVKSLVQKVKKESKRKKKKSKKLKKQKRRRSVSESNDSDQNKDIDSEELEEDGEEEENRRRSTSEEGNKPGMGLAARALLDLKTTTERKRKGLSLDDAVKKKTSKKDSLFETAAKEMESINEAISESNDVLKELEDLINN